MTTDEMKALVTPEAKRRAKTIDLMHRIHGDGEGTCADCVHLTRKVASRNWYKCRFCNPPDRGASSDWRKHWPACGLKEAK